MHAQLILVKGFSIIILCICAIKYDYIIIYKGYYNIPISIGRLYCSYNFILLDMVWVPADTTLLNDSMIIKYHNQYLAYQLYLSIT